MYLRLLRRNRDFRLLYVGTLISLGGDWFLTVALLDLVLQLTGSATLASLMLLCQSLPIFIVTPIAGHVVDRVDRRKLMVLVDVARTGACLLPLLARTPALLPFAYLGVIGISIGSAYFEPASQAALPNIVSEEELGPANVLMGSTWGTMLAVGAAIGGVVTMRFGRDVSFVVDAISFLVSAGVLWMMRARFNESREHHDAPPLLESVRETARLRPRESARPGTSRREGRPRPRRRRHCPAQRLRQGSLPRRRVRHRDALCRARRRRAPRAIRRARPGPRPRRVAVHDRRPLRLPLRCLLHDLRLFAESLRRRDG